CRLAGYFPPVPCVLYRLSLLSHHPRDRLAPHSFPTRRSSDLSCTPYGYTPSYPQFRLPGKGDTGISSIAVIPSSDSASNRGMMRSEEHTSELQSRFDLVCRLLLEKKNRVE